MKTISENGFIQFQKLVKSLLGITLTESKKAMIIARLSTRLRDLGLVDLEDYLQYIKREGKESELEILINRITTNETYFFREEIHFAFLAKYLNGLMNRAEFKSGSTFRIWSSACSTGEEPYSIAITLKESLAAHAFDYRILASDINTEVLATAIKGRYSSESVRDVEKNKSPRLNCNAVDPV